MFQKIINSKIYPFLVLLMISGWIHLLGHTVDEYNRVSISMWAILLQLFAYSLGVLGVLYNFSNSLKLLKQSWLFVLLLLFCCASVFWSENLYFTATRLIGVIGVVMIALYIATRISIGDLLQWLPIFFLILIAINYCLIYFFPEIAIERYGRWRGLFVNINQLGLTMMIVLLLVYIQLLTRTIKWQGAFVLVSVIPLLYFSSSMTANITIVCVIIIATLLFLYYKYQFSMNWFWLLLLVAILLIYFFKNDFILSLGKRTTLSGRTIIWEVFFEQVKMAPLWGHGYGIGPDVEALKGLTKKAVSAGAHNGYLEVLFGLGWVGLSLLVVFIADMINKISLLLKYKYERAITLFFASFFAMFLIVNITESLILVRSGVFWTVFIIVVFKINEIIATDDEFANRVDL